MDLSDALGPGSWPGGQQSNQQTGGAVWPGGQPNQPGQQDGTRPDQPTWPGQPNQPGQCSWPGQQPGGPPQPTWPGQPNQPNQPSWPSPSGPSPTPGPAQSPMKLPYDMNLPNGCYDKLLITINGRVKPNANKITLNLSKGKDIAMHFNPRFNEDGKKAIVRNSFVGCKWGKEEREHKHFPFTAGQLFEMKILCISNEFRVAVNKVHLLEFKHRVRDIHNIKSLSIFGDIELLNVETDKLH